MRLRDRLEGLSLTRAECSGAGQLRKRPSPGLPHQTLTFPGDLWVCLRPQLLRNSRRQDMEQCVRALCRSSDRSLTLLSLKSSLGNNITPPPTHQGNQFNGHQL